MYIDNFYLPKFDFGNEPDVDGFIPDQNALPYDSIDDLRMQQAINDDLSQQLHNYIQQHKPVQNEPKRNYIVIDSGNTLSQLAKQYNTTVEDLARLNGIKDINRIKAGQVLRLNNKVANKYKDYAYTNRTRRPAVNTDTQTNARNYADEAVITAPRRTTPKRSTNVGKKPQTKSATNKRSFVKKIEDSVNGFMHIPIKNNSNGQLSAFSDSNDVFGRIKRFFYTPPGAKERVAERRRQLRRRFTLK